MRPGQRDWSARLDEVDFARHITAAMDARGAFLGPALAAVLDDLPAQRVLDVGGSSGIYACAVLDRRPGTLAAVFERAPVDAAARTLLAASYAALPPGGWLVDHDTHIDADKHGPLPVAEYSVLLMHSTPGKCYSIRELAEMAQQVGFVDVEHRPTAADRSAVLAGKPA